jgi:hypothetical protein
LAGRRRRVHETALRRLKNPACTRPVLRCYMRSSIWIGVFLGSTIGGLIPELWGGGYALLFGSAAQRGRRLCGTVARAASVKMTETTVQPPADLAGGFRAPSIALALRSKTPPQPRRITAASQGRECPKEGSHQLARTATHECEPPHFSHSLDAAGDRFRAVFLFAPCSPLVIRFAAKESPAQRGFQSSDETKKGQYLATTGPPNL